MIRIIQKTSGDGIVCAVGKGAVFVAPIPPSPNNNGCGTHAGCGKCGGCLPADAASGGYAGRLRVRVDNPENFKPGDRVAFCRFILEPNITSALIFGLPVILAVAVILYTAVNAPRQAESLTTLFSAVSAFIGGIIITGILDKIFKAKYPARIIDTFYIDNGPRPLGEAGL